MFVGGGTLAALAVKQATSTIPIVFSAMASVAAAGFA
jgi:ABC-type uncharacterized transport system substrate-binding protein